MLLAILIGVIIAVIAVSLSIYFVLKQTVKYKHIPMTQAPLFNIHEGYVVPKNLISPHLKLPVPSKEFSDFMDDVRTVGKTFVEWADKWGLEYHIIGGNLLAYRRWELSGSGIPDLFPPWDDDLDVWIHNPEALAVAWEDATFHHVDGDEWEYRKSGDYRILHHNTRWNLVKFLDPKFGNIGVDLFCEVRDVPSGEMMSKEDLLPHTQEVMDIETKVSHKCKKVDFGDGLILPVPINTTEIDVHLQSYFGSKWREKIHPSIKKNRDVAEMMLASIQE